MLEFHFYQSHRKPNSRPIRAADSGLDPLYSNLKAGDAAQRNRKNKPTYFERTKGEISMSPASTVSQSNSTSR
jgi:hypothetical protein